MGRTPELTETRVLDIMRNANRPVWTASQLADRADVSRLTAHKRLKELEAAEKVESIQVGNATAYYLVGIETQPVGDGEGGGDKPVSPEEIERRELTKVAIRLYKPWDDDAERSYEEVADAIAEKSDTWVGNRVREWKKGEHRELVPDPRKT